MVTVSRMPHSVAQEAIRIFSSPGCFRQNRRMRSMARRPSISAAVFPRSCRRPFREHGCGCRRSPSGRNRIGRAPSRIGGLHPAAATSFSNAAEWRRSRGPCRRNRSRAPRASRPGVPGSVRARNRPCQRHWRRRCSPRESGPHVPQPRLAADREAPGPVFFGYGGRHGVEEDLYAGFEDHLVGQGANTAGFTETVERPPDPVSRPPDRAPDRPPPREPGSRVPSRCHRRLSSHRRENSPGYGMAPTTSVPPRMPCFSTSRCARRPAPPESRRSRPRFRRQQRSHRSQVSCSILPVVNGPSRSG